MHRRFAHPKYGAHRVVVARLVRLMRWYSSICLALAVAHGTARLPAILCGGRCSANGAATNVRH